MPWFDLPGLWSIGYGELTTDPTRMINKLAELLGSDPDTLQSAPSVKNLLDGRKRVYNYGVGTAGRHLEEFSAEDREYLLWHCSGFISFCEQIESVAKS